jgi:hypothetical protein
MLWTFFFETGSIVGAMRRVSVVITAFALSAMSQDFLPICKADLDA